MTEDAKSRYEDDKPHYEVIRAIVKEEVAAIYRNFNWALIIACSVVAFIVGNQFYINGKFGDKADKNEVITTMQYYQIEEDEHRMILELFPDVNKAMNVFNRINDNTAASLGFKYSPRGATSKP
ncbi:MAG: hypothetical protein JZU49_01185 [Sulfuricurvum sp.]|nr:hypothetical protein [Sulfuricurvum sp.]